MNAAAEHGIVEHVDHRAVDVGDWNLGVMPPDWLGTKNLVGGEMLQGKVETLPFLVLLTNGLTGDDDNILEDLLRKVPMLGSGSAGDISRAEQRGYENPAIVQDTVRAKGVDRRRNISSRANPADPTLLAPPCQTLCGIGA